MGETVAGSLGSVFRLVYRSHARIPAGRRRSERDAILGVACAKNAAAGITGALLAWEDAFVQVLEGDEAAVRAVFATIRADPRHDHVRLLDADTVPDRVFAGWSMAAVGDDQHDDIPLPGDGVARGAAPSGDPRQITMLDLMCSYARADVGPG